MVRVVKRNWMFVPVDKDSKRRMTLGSSDLPSTTSSMTSAPSGHQAARTSHALRRDLSLCRTSVWGSFAFPIIVSRYTGVIVLESQSMPGKWVYGSGVGTPSIAHGFHSIEGTFTWN